MIKKISILMIVLLFLILLTECKKEKEDKSWLALLPLLNTSTTTTKYRIFVTTSTYAGNLGGSSGADSKCNSDAGKPNTGTYKAIIVDSARVACTTASCSGGTSENTNWVLKPNTAYYKSDGTTLVGTTNAGGVFTFALQNSIGTGANSWTGLATEWTTSTTCVNWTEGVAGNGSCGIVNSTTSTSISDSGASTCSSLKPLICVEQ